MTEFNVTAAERILSLPRRRRPRRIDSITPEHFSEAIQYRTFDRTLWV